MRVVVAYDIARDRHRQKVADIFQAVLDRVQLSVFEGDVPEEVLEKSIRRALQHLDGETDSLRVYHLCGACASRVDVYGRSLLRDRGAVRIL